MSAGLLQKTISCFQFTFRVFQIYFWGKYILELCVYTSRRCCTTPNLGRTASGSLQKTKTDPPRWALLRGFNAADPCGRDAS